MLSVDSYVSIEFSCLFSNRVDPTYFFQESILTEALHDTPTFEVP